MSGVAWAHYREEIECLTLTSSCVINKTQEHLLELLALTANHQSSNYNCGYLSFAGIISTLHFIFRQQEISFQQTDVDLCFVSKMHTITGFKML